MLPVIIGKSKTTVSPMPSNLLVVGGSFTGRLKIYDRDTLQEVTGVDTSAMTNINSLAYDSDYIYVGGNFTAAPYARKISRETRIISALASGAPNTPLGKNCIVADSGVVYTAPTTNTQGRLYRIDTTGGTPSYVAQGSMTYNDLKLRDGYLYAYINNRSTNFWILKTTSTPLAASTISLTLTGSAVRSLAVDSNFLYFGSTISGDFHVYDLALTTEQTGYPTSMGGIYSILNDDTNVYIGSTGYFYVINKASKSISLVELYGFGGTLPVSGMTQDMDYVYISYGARIIKISKLNLAPTTYLNTGISSGISTIMVI